MSDISHTPEPYTQNPKLEGLSSVILAGIFTAFTLIVSLIVSKNMGYDPKYLNDAGGFFWILPLWIPSVLCSALALRAPGVQHKAIVYGIYAILAINLLVMVIPIISGFWYSWELTN